MTAIKTMLFLAFMKEISIVTTNELKFKVAKKMAELYDVEVVSKKIETPEIQSVSVKEVAEYSAKYAAEYLGKPAIVTDTGLNIKALNGFPGPFVKYINEWFTSQDYLNLMKGKTNREVEWHETVAYCEPGQDPISATSIGTGKLAEKAEGSMPRKVIQEIFVSDATGKIGATLTQEEHVQAWTSHGGAWEELFAKLEQLGKIEKK